MLRVKGVEPELLFQMKMRALTEGKTLKAWTLAHIRTALNLENDHAPAATPAQTGPNQDNHSTLA